MKLAQSGDGDAFRWLMEHYELRLKSFLSRRMGVALATKTTLEDLFQEVTQRALASIDTFRRRGPNSFRRWLNGIARNVINDKVRYFFETPRANEQSLDARPLEGTEIANDKRLGKECLTPSRLSRREERMQRLNAAFHRLPPDHQRALYLARIDRLPVREVAVLMERTPAAVSSLLLRALRELRKEFGSDTGSFGLPDRPLDGPTNGVGGGLRGGPRPGLLAAAADNQQAGEPAPDGQDAPGNQAKVQQ